MFYSVIVIMSKLRESVESSTAELIHCRWINNETKSCWFGSTVYIHRHGSANMDADGQLRLMEVGAAASELVLLISNCHFSHKGRKLSD